MEYRRLGNTGLEVSILSFGASSLGGVFRPVNIADCIKTVQTALDLGINFLDVSPAYGETLAETNLGVALKGVPRETYYLATKIGSYSEARGDYDYSAGRTEQSVQQSLARLGVEYVDIVQCHDIEFADHDQLVTETLPALQRLKEKGLTRFIGLTGLPLKVFPSVLGRVEPGTVDTILSFCHYELNDNSLLNLIPYLKEKGIGIINASPTGMGLLTPDKLPDWHPASREIVEGCRRAVDYCRAKGADIVQLAIQYACANPEIATTLVGTARPQNIVENVRCLSRPIDQQLLAEVLDILKPVHNWNFTRGLPKHHDPLLGPAG